MGKVVWHITMSLDGFIAGADDAMDWVNAIGRQAILRGLVVQQKAAIRAPHRASQDR